MNLEVGDRNFTFFCRKYQFTAGEVIHKILLRHATAFKIKIMPVIPVKRRLTNYSILFNNVEFDLMGHRYPYRSFIDVMTMNLQQRYCKDQQGTEGSSPSPSPHTISLISFSFLDNLVKLHEEEAIHIIFVFCIVLSYTIILEVRVKICKIESFPNLLWKCFTSRLLNFIVKNSK